MPADRALTRAAVTTHTRTVRRALILSLTPALQTLVTTPGVVVEDRARAAFRDALLAYEALVKAGHTGNPTYEFRDLPVEERESHERTVHLLHVLDSLHGPKEGCAGGC